MANFAYSDPEQAPAFPQTRSTIPDVEVGKPTKAWGIGNPPERGGFNDETTDRSMVINPERTLDRPEVAGARGQPPWYMKPTSKDVTSY